MNLVPRSLTDWLGPLIRRLMLFGFQVEGEEIAADLVEKGNAARLRGAKSSLESLKMLKQLDDGDEASAEVIALFQKGTIEQNRLMQEFLEGPQPAVATAKAMDRPFSNATPIGIASGPDSEQGRGTDQEGVTQPMPRRGRGRPRKDQPRA